MALPILGARPVYIAGPCVIEDEAMAFEVARLLAELRDSLGIGLIFKASFDKANRSAATAYRGPGLEDGLRILAEVKARFALPVLTDVHLPEQCARVAEVADVLQIPAFLCRQTDLITSAAATGRVVNIKRGQFLDPRRMGLAVEKATGAAQIWVTERGTSFGHGDLVFDPRALPWLAQSGAPVFYDCTHSVQVPGGIGPTTGGNRGLALPLARAAAAVGVDGFYAEVHPNPASARSDAATQLDPSQLRDLLRQTLAIDAARRLL